MQAGGLGELDGEVVRTQLVITLDGSSMVRSGDRVKVWMDASKVHLFDPSSTDNLTVDLTHAGRIPAQDQTVAG